MGNLLSDLRHSWRVLIKSPGFALIAVGALALGIGANTAIFSVIEKVLLRPLPFHESERILQIRRHLPQSEDSSFSVPRFMAMRDCQAFQSMAIYTFGSLTVNLGSGDYPDPVTAMHVSADFFDVFGVSPVVGRTFSRQEDLPHAGKFAVLTYGFWKNRFSGDPAIVGRTLALNKETYAIIGVLPEDYQPDPPTQVYLPSQLDPASVDQGDIYIVSGRLKPGVTIQTAKAELAVISDRFRSAHPDAMDKDETVTAVPLRDAISGDVRPALLIIGGAVSFVLLIACANVANLLLARAAGRHRELAVRTAVGASRGRIVSQLLTESMLLAIAGGAAGLLVAEMGVKALLAFSPGDIPRINDPGHPMSTVSALDWRVLLFLLGISILTGVIFGLLPALRISKLDVNVALKESASRSGTGLKHNRVRGALVVAEIALALVLLAGAALMIRTFAGLRSVKPGLDASNVLTLTTATSGSKYAATAPVESMVRQASERIEALPGVEFAAAGLALPMDGIGIDLPFAVEGRAPKQSGKWEGDEEWRFVSPHYFEALRIPLLRGRFFDRRDAGKSSAVVIINEAFAKKYFANEDPLGKRLMVGQGLGADYDVPVREIVGIVGSVTETGLGDGPVPVTYTPQGQVTDTITKLANSLMPLSWVIRTKTDPLTLASAISQEFTNLDPQLTVSKIRTMNQVMANSTQRENFTMLLLSVFASIALLLAAIGIYGLMAYAVEQRTQEIGIRMALGADRAATMRMILGHGVRLAAIGIVIGLPAAYGLARVIEHFSLLSGVKSNDPWSFAAVAAILATVTILAAFVPARRATNVDPILALRCE